MNKLTSITVRGTGLLLGVMLAAIKGPSFYNETTKLPAESCGDSGRSEVWWPVFLNEGDLEQIKQEFCRDAFIAKRAGGTSSIQLASFKSRERAETFAAQVNGEVGSPSHGPDVNKEQQPTTQDADIHKDDTDNQASTQDADMQKNATEQQSATQETDTYQPQYVPPSAPPNPDAEWEQLGVNDPWECNHSSACY